MKAAAAVLGASLLFFVGVLTGAGGRASMPPPAAIPLGAGNPASAASAAGSQGTPSDAAVPPGSAPAPATKPAPGNGSGPSTAGTSTGPRTEATASTTTTTRQAGPGGATPPATAAPPASTTTTAPAQVEQVDNQVDCGNGKRGKGKREPCGSTTTGPAAGGSNGRTTR